MIALAWVLSIVGAIWAYIIDLAGAMRTIPRLYWREALMGIPLPRRCPGSRCVVLFRPPQPPQTSGDRPWLSAGIPLALAIFTLLLLADEYFNQPGGPT